MPLNKAVIEMPKGTRYKYEIDKDTGLLLLDRPIEAMVPHNYGFIPETMCEDGDALDVFVASFESIPSLATVSIEIIGYIQGKDGGKQDDKLLAYVNNDEYTKSLLQPAKFVEQCIRFLTSYKKGYVVEAVLMGKEPGEECLRLARLAHKA